MTSTGRRGFVAVDRSWLANPDLSDSGLRLMLWLDSHSDEYLSKLSVKRTADEIGWSRDRVTRTLEHLTELELIDTEQVPHPEGGKTRTKITLHLSRWTEGYATPQGTRMPHGEAQGMPHDEAATTSNPNGQESNGGGSNVVDDSTLTHAELLCIQMADAIAVWSNDKRPTITKTWVTDMDRLMRLDRRDAHQVERVIRWLYTSPDRVATFWAPNIQSPNKLRAQWIKMAKQYEGLVDRPAHKSDIQNDLDRLRARDTA